jgi:hypothetical protein
MQQSTGTVLYMSVRDNPAVYSASIKWYFNFPVVFIYCKYVFEKRGETGKILHLSDAILVTLFLIVLLNVNLHVILYQWFFVKTTHWSPVHALTWFRI